MKKTLIISLLAILSSVNNVFSQCDEYYINELISGSDDVCYFPNGSPVRFCPRLKGISINGLTLDVMQWDGYSTQYLTLTKNGGIAGTMVLKLKEKELVVNLQGCGGSRTYSISLTKSEYSNYESQRESLLSDQKIKIELMIGKGSIDDAIYEISKTNFSQNEENNLIQKVNSALINHPIKTTITLNQVDSLLKVKGKNKFELPAGVLTIKSIYDKGIVIMNALGNEVLVLSEKPFLKKIYGFEFPVVFDYTFKYFEKTSLSCEELLDSYIGAVTITDTDEALVKKIKKIKSFEKKMNISMSEISFPLVSTSVWIAPNFKGEKLEGQGAVFQKSFFDGTNGITMSMQTGQKDLTTEEIAAKSKSVGLFPEMNYTTSGMKYEILGVENINGSDAYVLKVNDGETLYFDYFDTQTFMKVKSISFRKEGEATVENCFSYSDFKEVNGLMFAHTINITIGETALTGKVTSIIVNGKIDIKAYK